VPTVTGEHGAANGSGNKRAKNGAKGGESAQMDFPQHKLSILTPQMMREITTNTGARIRYTEGCVKTGAVKKGVQAGAYTRSLFGSTEAIAVG
jgi:hypothetical protein